jgi:acid phosphatase (class A)
METKINRALLSILFTLIFGYSYCQFDDGSSSSESNSARGYYKYLSSFSPLPINGHSDLDKIKFPFNESRANKILSEKPYYLRDVTLNDFTLPDPPANSSAETRQELNYLLSLQHDRTAEDIRSSLYMSSNFLTPSDMGRIIGYWVETQKLPLTDSLMEKIASDGNFFLWSIKLKYNRPRPYMLDSKIHDLEESDAASYPSGHVTYAYIYAFVYKELAPEFKDYFISQAYDMSRARQIIGVHYPSDCEVSRIFARQLVDMLFKNKKFLADFQNVKNEWEQHKLKPVSLTNKQ